MTITNPDGSTRQATVVPLTTAVISVALSVTVLLGGGLVSFVMTRQDALTTQRDLTKVSITVDKMSADYSRINERLAVLEMLTRKLTP